MTTNHARLFSCNRACACPDCVVERVTVRTARTLRKLAGSRVARKVLRNAGVSR
jgi:hypothetical protein